MAGWLKFIDIIGSPIEGIYKFLDLKTEKTKIYIGQSEDVARRLKEHIADEKLDKADLEKVEVKPVDGGKLQREIEEQKEIEDNDGIRKKGGGKLSNKRNPLGKKRKKFLGLF